jgi:hypothetical protein
MVHRPFVTLRSNIQQKWDSMFREIVDMREAVEEWSAGA